MDDPGVLQSAVRVPTPPPGALSPSAASRKRSPPSRSPPPNRRRSPPGDFSKEDAGITGVESARAIERERQLADRVREHEQQEAARKPLTEEEKQASAKAEYEKLLNMRSGGTYIPPARLRALQAQITDKTSKEYQRMAWEALKKSINGLINKVNVSNIKYIVPELFGENLVRGRGLFCRSIMKAQAASLPFTPIYAAMTAIVNTKLPQVGDLLLSRLIIQFRKAFKRNDKAVCISSTTFIAHLCNTQVAHEMLAAQILLLLLHKPTDDSVEIAVGLTREVGHHLEEMNPPIALAVFDQFRNILHEADIDKRVQYMIEVLFQVRKDRYKDNPAVKEELDLVEEEDQITHRLGLDDEIESQDTLNIFKFDPEWEKHEEAYKKLKAEILGEDSDEDEDEQNDDDESSEEESDAEEQKMDIKDQSNTDLVNLRRTIYLTIMSSIDFEECCHKLMKINLPAGLEPELPSMIIECCSQERTFSKFYGLIGERFAKINRLWSDLFEAAFAKYYDTIHRYETNRLRNIARFFGHMIGNDAIGWHVLSVVHMNEEETTSSSRIFIKILFQDLAEHMGLPTLQSRFRDEILRPSFEGLFPTDNPRYTRFSINYFTSIGMGVLTEDMREHLKNAPKPALPALPAGRSPSRTPSVRSHPASCSTCTPRSSRSPSRSRSRSYSYSRSPSRDRGRSYSRSITPSSRDRSNTPSRSRSRSRSPPRRSRRHGSDSRSRTPSDRSRSVSRTPPRRTRARSVSRTPSRSPYRARRSVSRSVTPPRRGRSYSRSVSRSVTPNRAPASKAATRSSVSVSSRRVRDQSSHVASHTSTRRRDDSRPRQNCSQTPPPTPLSDGSARWGLESIYPHREQKNSMLIHDFSQLVV
ncbi:MIF4G-domain-containing protein [Penicillium pulvis]|uniref:MIF4G-domain-containing protein n=1 Tax=Penicillium pulvis TaxID=1562058 RepID=UPI0025473AD1|nr:MIF4G-domain-containing protein [Penicillium pulvis]KAJ5803673.1 MIF4G-domain-containing protein [Penicillium pulvis]